MSFLIVRSVPLSQETRAAWKNAGGTFARRKYNGRLPDAVVDRYGYIVNLGHTRLSASADVIYNRPDSIVAVSHPVNFRKTFHDSELIPSRNMKGRHWHKTGGFRGEGKTFHESERGDCAVIPGDVQEHIEGVEYRVITVGDVVVQAHKKELINDGWPPIPTGFEWSWVGVRGVSSNGIIPAVKNAITKIPFGERTVLGWDIIVRDRNQPFIIEINTSPGVNDATAQRIVSQIERNL
jgi:hypothetical protein